MDPFQSQERSGPINSTAQMLPEELLSEIFIHCLPQLGDALPLQPDVTAPPLLLCHVCSYWRATALVTPRLWAEIALQLEYVSVRSHLGGGFLRQKLRVLEVWTARMGAISPSIHFQRSHLRVHVSNDVAEVKRRFITWQEFFNSPAIVTANLLSFHAFGTQDLIRLSTILPNLSFPHLKYLIMSQPSGREHNTSTPGSRTYFSSTNSPNLTRFYLDCHTEITSNPCTIMAAFSWSTLTHLAANLKLRQVDWYTLLDRCSSLTHCAIKLEFIPTTMTTQSPIAMRGITTRRLLEASIETTSHDLPLIFDKFDLPRLRKLRLSLTDKATTVAALHAVLVSTPTVHELHLQGCIPFGTSRFEESAILSTEFTGSTADLAAFKDEPKIPLSTLIPNLNTLVIDSIGFRIPASALPRDLLVLLRSTWLCAGWSSELDHSQDSSGRSSKRTIHFVLDKGYHFSHSIIGDLNEMITVDRAFASKCPFILSASYCPKGLWQWKQLNGIDLRDGWDRAANWMS